RFRLAITRPASHAAWNGPSSPRQHRLQRRCRQQQLSSQQKRKLICSSDRDNQFSESWESLFQTRPAFFLLALRGRPLISCCSRADIRRRQTLTPESHPVNGRELWRQRCGRFLKVKNRPRADPVGGLGGGDRDAIGDAGGPMLGRNEPRVCIALPNVDSVK